MRSGPKGNSPEHQMAVGESRPSRRVVNLYPDEASRPDPENIPAPKGMTPAAKKVWTEKVERYRQRGQKVQGRENALRAYCETEARLWKLFKTQDGPSVGLISAHRAWCNEFHDTPAAQKSRPMATGADNRFKSNVRPAAAV